MASSELSLIAIALSNGSVDVVVVLPYCRFRLTLTTRVGDVTRLFLDFDFLCLLELYTSGFDVIFLIFDFYLCNIS